VHELAERLGGEQEHAGGLTGFNDRFGEAEAIDPA